LSIFALADLHLSFSGFLDVVNWEENREYKPMEDLDQTWHNHARRIYENWHRLVQEWDIVLVPGDISWAIRLDDARPDLNYLGLLPGRLVCVQGNHDYWWQSISQARKAVPSNVQLIQNDHVRLDGVNICGTRGWLCPNGTYFKQEDEKIYRRELIRLENSLQSAKTGPRLVMMHYMPTNEKHDYSGFIELFQKYEVETVVYGHIHSNACRYRLPNRAWDINFHLTSADYLNFTPRLIMEC
jgi:predicted phosphohydrolase